ncbi:17691_t:CDS:1, partial [Racocetra persica]
IIPYNPIVENFHNQEELDKSILLDESNLNESSLNNEQINRFKKIYYENKIENIDDNNEDSILNIKNKLEKKDEEAQYKKLQTTICCKEKYLQNLVSHKHAILNYQNFQNLNNNQKNMFLLEILSATARQEITTIGQKRNKLA